MGEAKRRGTFEERKAQAIAAGRRKARRLQRPYVPISGAVIDETASMLPMIALLRAGLLRRPR